LEDTLGPELRKFSQFADFSFGSNSEMLAQSRRFPLLTQERTLRGQAAISGFVPSADITSSKLSTANERAWRVLPPRHDGQNTTSVIQKRDKMSSPADKNKYLYVNRKTWFKCVIPPRHEGRWAYRHQT
jgi:hypothetical protein